MARKQNIMPEEIIVDMRYDTPPPNGQVILFEQYSLLKRTWKWLLLIAVLVTAGVIVYTTQFVEKEYLGVAVAVMPNKSGTPLDNILGGGFSGRLSDFGLSSLVGRRGGQGGYTPTVIMTSTVLVDSLIAKYDLHTVYDVPKERYDIVRGILLGNISVELSQEGPITVNVYDTDPKRAAAIANDVVAYTNSIARELNRRETEPITQMLERRYNEIRQQQIESGAKLKAFMSKTKIVDPERQATALSTALVQARAERDAANTVYEVLRGSLGPDDPRTVQQAAIRDKAERTYEEVYRGDAKTPSIAQAPASMVEYLKLQEDYEVNAKVLALVMPMYQQSRFDQLREVPIMQMLSPATPPLQKARPKNSIVAASAFVGTFLIGYLVLALVAYMRAFRLRYAQYSMRFHTNGHVAAPAELKKHGEYLP